MPIKERVIEFIKSQGLKVSEFEKRCGLSNGYVSSMRKGLGELKLNNVLNQFPALNRDWLLYGEGEMLKPNGIIDEANRATSDKIEMINSGINNGSFRMVPLINIDSVGGIHSDNAIIQSEQYVIKMMPFTEAREGDVAIMQSGNSMYPTIPSGSALLIREVVDWREYFGYGNIYVLWLKDGRRITKEVRRYDADPKNFVWCVSYNPDVADEELPRSMIRGVWKVVKYIADFGW